MKNPFDIYTSKVKRFNIPLPEFEYHHKSSSEEQVDKKFIGRRRISERLYNWLTDEKTKSGSYLVTGYRGMGKSSFVGKTLYELCGQVNVWLYTIGFMAFIFIWGILFYAIFKYEDIKSIEDYLWPVAFIALSLVFLICIYKSFAILNFCRHCLFLLQVFGTIIKKANSLKDYVSRLWSYLLSGKRKAGNWKRILYELYNTDTRRKSFLRISISINLGQEILNEKDVLCLIANELYIKYRYYIYSPIANLFHWIINTFFVFGLAFSMYILCPKIEEIKIGIISIPIGEDTYIKRCLFIAIFILIAYLIFNLLTSHLLFTQKRILRKLRFLNERLDTFIENDMGVKAESNYISLHSNKKKIYPLANIREIEQELIDILERIKHGILPSPSFIFVFDELDKIEPDASHESSLSNPIPEYTNEKNFPGGGTSRKRKQNVLHLLANMKLFVSTAKAKFIFISGRELYDAYLADLSDREFAISSIFNGIIYVESFCTSEGKEKDIMSNAEIYICRQLIPRQYIRKQCIEHYIKCKSQSRYFDRVEVDLKLYYKYLIDEYKKIPEYREILNTPQLSDQDCPIGAQNLSCSIATTKLTYIRIYIDKAILLLYHFSVYLYHISNGSPKKMTLYFEKFIRQTIDYNRLFLRKNETFTVGSILEDKDINIRISRKSKYYLSFGYLDQRKIGFVHYISYPVTQAIINANQFGDKLLVSASFLIDHIYKFHNSGFSWRNLEHTPELLEVYRIPEFRGFIHSIISYLTQTHLIPISCGLYQFKFRKQFAEEISLASKFSEEIAAMFNFTLDESLSVKWHYKELQNHFSKQLNEEKTDSPHVKAGFHHILADLFMSDEEYTNAIFEYQTAIRVATPERVTERDLNDPHFISQMLLIIRNMLKLGLAYEKRKTHESAYATYNELIGRLIRFRYLNEEDLGLDYLIEKQDGWPVHRAVLYAGKHPCNSQVKDKKVIRKVCPPIYGNCSNSEKDRFSLYRTNGSDILTDFAHQMTIEKNPIIQRLSLLEDVRLVYQALLAKLFVLEKIELGGITRANLELLESEYIFLHLATNEKDKFLISTDFFRRLGDIMFYKNGLAGQETDSFFAGLYYWAYNVKTEILDFCNEYHCYYLRNPLQKFLSSIKNDYFEGKNIVIQSFEEMTPEKYTVEYDMYLKNFTKNVDKIDAKEKLNNFFSIFISKMKYISLEEVILCNSHRQEMWNAGKPLPCYACKYYNRSMRILMDNLYNFNIEEKCKRCKCSKTIIILELLLKEGKSKSFRQNFTLQFAEILDCMGNVMLSCSHKDAKEDISKEFLYAFLEDVHFLNISADQPNKVGSQLIKIYRVDKGTPPDLSKLERSILYYWEASECFRIGDEQKKASDSLKKILRLLQNYLKVKENHSNNKEDDKEIIGEFLNEIKNRIVKRSLLYLYSHYNYINITEIQKLKWIFSVEMYESISLNHLSLFPDVEEIMLIYYEMIKLCLLSGENHEIKVLPDVKNRSWTTLTQRNIDFRIRLASIYHSVLFTAARMESTIYERVLSLRFRAMLNQEILHHLVRTCGSMLEYYNNSFEKSFVVFIEKYLGDSGSLANLLQEYKNCFKEVLDTEYSQDNTVDRDINTTVDHCMDTTENNSVDTEKDSSKDNKEKGSYISKLYLLEFLIKDSMYCLTKILETITPYTSTTLFTNTFLGEIHQKLFEWNLLFDALYKLYKLTDLDVDSIVDSQNHPIKCVYMEGVISNYPTVDPDRCWSSKCPYQTPCHCKPSDLRKMRVYLQDVDEKLREKMKGYRGKASEKMSHRFFISVLKDIGK